MIGLIPYILILLSISAVSMFFIGRVVAKQVGLFKSPITDADIRHFRRSLFYISLTIILMGLIPIAINIYTAFYPTGRAPIVPLISFVYSMGVHLQTLFLSYLLWRIYRLASNSFNDKDK